MRQFVAASGEWTRPVVSKGVADDWPMLLDAALDRSTTDTGHAGDSGLRREVGSTATGSDRRFFLQHMAVRQVSGNSTVAVVAPSMARWPHHRRAIARCTTVDDVRIELGFEPESVELAPGDMLFVPRRHLAVVDHHDTGWHVQGWWHARRSRRLAMTRLVGHVAASPHVSS